MNKNIKKSTRYLVHWETQSKNLLKNFCSLMEHQSLVDVIICCGNNAIQAHKLVLAANSPLFREEFEKNSAIEQILINGCDFTVVKNLVELMYCGQTIINEENTKFLISMVKLLQMKQFENLFSDHGASTEDIYLPKPQFLTTKPKYPEFNYPTTQQGSKNNTNNKNNAQLRGNLSNIIKEQTQTISESALKPPLNPLNLNLSSMNENKANNKNNNNYNNNNRGGKKTLKQQAEQACVKEAQASRLALASLQKSIAATQVNSFIIEDTCTETTVENFIPNTVVDDSVNPFIINYPNLGNPVHYLPPVEANNEQTVKNTLTTDKLKDILKSDVPSNVEIMYKDAQGNLIPVNEEVLQSLSTKYGIQYQIVDEDGTYSEMKELNIENTEEFSQSLNAPSANKPIIEVGDFLNQTECTLSISNGKFCSMITPSGNDIKIPSLSVLEPSEPIKTEEELTFIPEMFFSELITNQVQNNDTNNGEDDIFIEKVLE